MASDTPTAVDRYIEATLNLEDLTLSGAIDRSNAEGLPSIAVTPALGAMLHSFARMVRATRVLEIGTLGGYSTIWLARALPADGVVISLELDQHHADVAARNVAAAGLSDRVQIRVGPALESLEELERERPSPFDVVFVDADKVSAPEYFAAALRLVRPGAAIVVDNVVRDGAVLDASSTDPSVTGMRRLLSAVAATPSVTATVIQTVGAKGYDGFLLATVL